MEILFGLIGVSFVIFYSFWLAKMYKKRSLMEQEQKQFYKNLESRLACVEQRFFELEKDYENHILED